MLSGVELTSLLAKYLLQVKEGERLKSVRQLARLNNTSVGTVSNALSSIENSGAIKIDRRGHMGSFIVSRSVGELWAIAEKEPLVISFPLIAHSRLEGLATALKKQLSKAHIDAYLIFIRGSRIRLKALQEKRCHIAVMSGYAADQLVNDNEQIVLELPAYSFLEGHEVFFRAEPSEPGRSLSVAIDRDSVDVETLTELEFTDNDVEFKPVTFMQLPRLLRNQYVDAGVWSIDDMRPHLDDQIQHRPLSKKVIEVVGNRDTAAALIACTENESVRAVVEATLHIDAILTIQQQVINGEIVPEY